MTKSRSMRRLACVAIAMAFSAAGTAQIWVPHGPRPNTSGQVEGITDGEVIGAVNAVATHPTDANTIYVGAVNGGIWRTTNATAASPSWVEQIGATRSLSIGAIEFDPTVATNQTLMAGTGRFSSFSSRGGDRAGVYRTTDGGTTWTLLTGGGTLTGLNISGVAPRGTTLVLSANAATAPATQGVWRSTDTGATWTLISGAAATGLPAGASFDLASDPSNTARLFTNAGTGGIFRSNDTGATWTKVSNAAIDALLTGQRVEISVGASNNVYVATIGAGRLTGLFRSGDGGTTWTALDLPTTTESGVVVGPHPGSQGNTHLSLVADRINANIVYLGGDRQPFLTEFTTGSCPCFPNSIGANDFTGRLFRIDASLAAGAQATHITNTNTTSGSSPHADSRDMAMDASGNLIETDDGGIYRRTTPTTNAGDWISLNGNLMVTELHDAAWDGVSKIAIGGAQDTGTPQEQTSNAPRWRSLSTADGGDVAVNDTGTPGISIRYSSNQRLGSFRRRSFDTANAPTATATPALTVIGGGAALTRPFVTPVAVNNVTPTRIIIGGGNSVYESLDQGDTITEIGPGIVVNSSDADPIAYGATGNADMLYVGALSQVFIRNAAAGALSASATYPGAARVVGIAIDPADPQTAFVADTGSVFSTADGGGTWTNITGNLGTLAPGTLRSIAFSTSNADGSVFVGSDAGVFVGRGPAFTTWAAAGTELPRVPVFDLDYDAADEQIIAGTLGRGGWTLNVDERDPADVALVLDLSGSMLSPACSTCAPKLDVLKDAVELFVQLWSVFAVPDDRLGVGYFRTTISEFLPGGNALFAVVPNATAAVADVRAQTTVGANLTAMGGGIQNAINRLNDPMRRRHLVVFTDGMQNVNPMVNATTFEIADEVGRPASNISATTPPTDLNAALGRKVSTIGVGASPAFVNLLDDIATETTGLFKQTTAPDDDLRRFYVEELVDILRTSSPQLAAYRYGTLAGSAATETFFSNGTAQKVVFKVSWFRPAQMDFTVEKDGTDVTSRGQVITGPFYKIFALDVPAPGIAAAGQWRLRISGTASARYEVAVILDEAAFKFDFAFPLQRILAGDAIPLRIRLWSRGKPVTNARVVARVIAPRVSVGTILATTPTPPGRPRIPFEPAATAGQRKYELLAQRDLFRPGALTIAREVALQHTRDGVYSGSFKETSVAGPYTIVYTVVAEDQSRGRIERTETRSVSVRLGPLSLGDSKLQIVPRRRELRVQPMDRYGNALGPDFASQIELRVNGKLQEPPRDVGDGSYIFKLASIDPTAKVALTVAGQKLYEGTLSEIAGGRQ